VIWEQNMKVIKYSRQREAVLAELQGRRDHPTASTIYEALRKEDEHISLGTVYRNLNLLAEQGTIGRIACADGTDRFDYDTSEHYHFACKSCGMVKDLYMKKISRLAEPIDDSDIGSIDSYSLIFYGHCKKCQKQIKRKGA
jgi:Fur family transcriptional regulator, peroxide stress response regulator